jgi:hypothetical protein
MGVFDAPSGTPSDHLHGAPNTTHIAAIHISSIGDCTSPSWNPSRLSCLVLQHLHRHNEERLKMVSGHPHAYLYGANR